TCSSDLRSVTMQGSGIDRFSERLRDLVLKELHVVAGVRADDLSRNHGDSGDLVRGETLDTDAGFRGRLLACLIDPSGSSLACRDDDFLPRGTKRHLDCKLHRRLCGAGPLNT